MKINRKNKFVGLLALLLVYLAAIAIGVFVFLALPRLEVYARVLLADIASTVFVYLFGVVLRSASVYDPYWSVQPPLIVWGLMAFCHRFDPVCVTIAIATALWSIRLTANFAIGFSGLGYEDWRYRDLREKTGRLFQLVNLLGICLFPTLIVYLGCLPFLFLVTSSVASSFLALPGVFVMLGGTALELVADAQLKRFAKRRSSRSMILKSGLFRYARHPNYLGEILFWVGMAASCLYACPANPWMYVGAAAIFLMFRFISVPMAENHQKTYKDDYGDYLGATHVFVPLPRLTRHKSEKRPS
ncbi:MAG: DUF1295 domain-containing protein [Bacilli bacterium]|jgi:steroid 5-alpha reductase family enzyme|nr:DUF1295 domain-containing protein [Bacilli bacterium]